LEALQRDLAERSKTEIQLADTTATEFGMGVVRASEENVVWTVKDETPVEALMQLCCGDSKCRGPPKHGAVREGDGGCMLWGLGKFLLLHICHGSTARGDFSIVATHLQNSSYKLSCICA